MFPSTSSLACTIASSWILAPTLAAAATYPNALAALEAQNDLTVVTGEIKADPVLKKMYTESKDITVTVPVDSSFPPESQGMLLDFYLIRENLQFTMIEGVYTTEDIKPLAKYPGTKLTNRTFVNLSRKNQPAKLVEEAGKKNVYCGDGIGATIKQGNIKFTNGILHKLASPINGVQTLKTTQENPFISYYPLTNLSALGVLDKLDTTKDITVFIVTNDAWTDLISKKICLPSLKSIPDILQYYAITGHVYRGDSFTGRKVRTLSGDEVTLKGYGDGQGKGGSDRLTVNGVKVVLGDVTFVNGVVHVLESPIYPPGDKPTFPKRR